MLARLGRAGVEADKPAVSSGRVTAWVKVKNLGHPAFSRVMNQGQIFFDPFRIDITARVDYVNRLGLYGRLGTLHQAWRFSMIAVERGEAQ